jgi:hypothetical protein
VNPGFRLAVNPILKHEQRYVEEQLLGLWHRDPMLFLIFSRVRSIPIKADDFRENNHSSVV